MSIRSFLGMILALSILSLSSCTMESAELLESKSYEFPDVSLTDATYVLGRSGEPKLTITADTIAIFEKTNRAEIDALQFFQLDEQGNVLLSGEADSATVHTETYDATLSGNILVTQKEEDFTIRAEKLLWLNDEQVLQSMDDSPVHILFDGGQSLEGSGFKGNLKKGLYEFTDLTEGVLSK